MKIFVLLLSQILITLKRIIAIVLTLAAMASAQAQTPAQVEKNIRKMTNEFISVIMTGKMEKALHFFSPAYIKEQNYNFLEGRTEQFVMEFLGGFVVNEEGEEQGFVTPDKNNIASMRIKDMTVSDAPEAFSYAYVEIVLKDGRKYVAELPIEVYEGKLKYHGAVG